MSSRQILLLTFPSPRLLSGVASYARPDLPWTFTIAPPTLKHLRKADARPPDGIIAYVGDEDIAEYLTRLQVPTVNVSGTLAHSPFPRIQPDNLQAGTLAAGHFLDRGFTNFAYVRLGDACYAHLRGDGFEQRITQAGFELTRLPLASVKVDLLSGATDLSSRYPDLSQFLVSTPKPCGVFCTNDDAGLLIAELCQELGIQVPEEIAVLGMDNMEARCLLCRPSLSSVITPIRRVGFEAAHLLHQRLESGSWKAQEMLLPSESVADRQSTELFAVPDAQVIRALRCIHTQARQELQVEDVARYAGISRRRLEQKFRQWIHRTPLQEITRIRLEHAKDLLRTTGLALPDVAEKSGFPSVKWMHAVFARDVGETPARYRRAHSAQNVQDGPP